MFKLRFVETGGIITAVTLGSRATDYRITHAKGALVIRHALGPFHIKGSGIWARSAHTYQGEASNAWSTFLNARPISVLGTTTVFETKCPPASFPPPIMRHSSRDSRAKS